MNSVITTLPRVWASNTNFSAGPDAGFPTKVDPGAALSAEGFEPGPVAAQHLNFELNGLTVLQRALLTKQLLQLRRVTLEGTSVSNTANSLGAAQRNRGTPLVLLKDQQALATGDYDRFSVQNATALGASHAAIQALSNATRIVALVNVISTGHASLAYTDDDGATWTVVSSGLSFGAGYLAYAPAGAVSPESFFMSTSGSAQLIAADAGTMSVGGMSNSTVGTPLGGLAAWFDGTNYKVVICGTSGSNPAFQQYHWVPGSPGNWNNSTGPTCTAPTGSFDEGGFLASNAGTTIYHCGRQSSGTSIKVSASTDGAVTWTTLATLSPQGSASFSARPRLLMCPNSGLMVIVAPTSGNQTCLFASVDGATWLGPQVLFPNLGINFSLAGGRLFTAKDDGGSTMLFATDGLPFT